MDKISEDLDQDGGTLDMAPRISYLTMDLSMDRPFTTNASAQTEKGAKWY